MITKQGELCGISECGVRGTTYMFAIEIRDNCGEVHQESFPMPATLYFEYKNKYHLEWMGRYLVDVVMLPPKNIVQIFYLKRISGICRIGGDFLFYPDRDKALQEQEAYRRSQYKKAEQIRHEEERYLAKIANRNARAKAEKAAKRQKK